MSSTPFNNHLHTGKWCQEEEMYAMALIEAFKTGELPGEDIEEGTSLRKYLAKKLMCSPKRVSKKFEGTNYNGKQVYGRTSLPDQQGLATRAKLQILEHDFLKTLADTATGQPQVSQPARLRPSFSQLVQATQARPNDRSIYDGLSLDTSNSGMSRSDMFSTLSYNQSLLKGGVVEDATAQALQGAAGLSRYATSSLVWPATGTAFQHFDPSSLPSTLYQQANLRERLLGVSASTSPSLPTGGNPPLSQLSSSLDRRALLEAAQMQQLLSSRVPSSIRSTASLQAFCLRGPSARDGGMQGAGSSSLDQLSMLDSLSQLDYLHAQRAAAGASGVAAPAPSTMDILRTRNSRLLQAQNQMQPQLGTQEHPSLLPNSTIEFLNQAGSPKRPHGSSGRSAYGNDAKRGKFM